jgi:exonuclease VII large subunit
MSNQEKNPSSGAAAQQPDDASLHKIREILVGPTTRAVDQRLDGFRKQIEATVEAVDKKHQESLEQARRAFETRFDELRRQAGAISEAISKLQTEMRQSLDREFETMRVEQAHQVLSLRAELVDRQTMASIFSEMALRVGCAMDAASIDPGRPDADLEALIEQRTSR